MPTIATTFVQFYALNEILEKNTIFLSFNFLCWHFACAISWITETQITTEIWLSSFKLANKI